MGFGKMVRKIFTLDWLFDDYWKLDDYDLASVNKNYDKMQKKSNEYELISHRIIPMFVI